MSETLHRGTIIDSINNQGFLRVELDLSRTDLDDIYDNFRASAYIIANEDPGHRIAKALYLPDDTYQGSQIGSLKRIQEGLVNGKEPSEPIPPGTDNKDIFYFTGHTFREAEEMLRDTGMPAEVRSLLDNCEEARQSLRRCIRPIFRELGIAEYFLYDEPGNDTYFKDDSNELHRIKIINYRDESGLRTRRASLGQAGLALAHRDYNRFTVAIDNTEEGLVGTALNWSEMHELLYNNRHLSDRDQVELAQSWFESVVENAIATDISLAPEESAFFVGAGYEAIPSDLQNITGNLPTLLHAVKDTGHGRDRFALIGFINELDHLRWPLVDSSDCEGEEIFNETVPKYAESISVINRFKGTLPNIRHVFITPINDDRDEHDELVVSVPSRMLSRI